MAYTTFLLDLDHTLFDTDASEVAAFEQTMLSANIEQPDRYLQAYQKINLDLWAAVERGEMKPDLLRTLRFERLVMAFELDADPEQLSDDYVTGLGAYGDLYDGAREVLEALSEQVSLGMVTNGLGEVQRSRIARLGLDEYFDAVAISAEIGAAKPDAAIFDLVFASLAASNPESAVMVGDNLSADIAGGANYGIATCWYNPNGRSTNGAHRIDHEIADLQDLLGLIAV
ncbi:MAG: YjjG family noncanonical pyrimidine nucleotidase [Woeseiaceae bacterium]